MILRSSKIFLIGLPGSGKSTMGRQLAENVGYSFIDLDDEVEKKAGCSIKEIFSAQGEGYFRNLERKTLMEVANTPGEFVIATGGGTPCFFDNISIIKKYGRSVFINTPLKELLSRLPDNEITKRPKFSGGEDLKEKLSKLFIERLPYYEQADYRLEGRATFADLVETVNDWARR